MMGEVCSRCRLVISGCEEIPATGHDPAEAEAVAPTCTEPGHEAGVVCSVCGETISGCEEIPVTDHDPPEVDAVAPTCPQPGHEARPATIPWRSRRSPRRTASLA